MPFLTSGRSRFLGGGRVPPTPVPVAGAELLTNGNMETGDPPTGWSAINSILSANSDVPTGGGLASLRIANSGTNLGEARQSIICAVGVWLKATAAIQGRQTGGQLRTAETTNLISAQQPINAWVAVVATGRITAANQSVRLLNLWNADGAYAHYDNVSCAALTLSSLISTRAYASADCDISAAVTRTAGTQAGISARVDSASSPANFLIAYLDGAGNVKVDKCVAGTYTNVISGAVTYGAGYILRLVCNGNNVSVYYNGTQVGTTQTVSDAGIVGNKNHGLFSSYSANTFSGYVAA